ncbi:MAG: class II aldolase/adducin family protein [Candidatus Cloacimonetes bacterium]|nr:class II aldolase/adducin family protein [Candidatus Cloacimonadota bacterium]
MHLNERKELIDICKLLYNRKLLSGMDGNVSIRVTGGFLTTPTGRNKYFLSESDLVFVNTQGVSMEAGKKASSEFEMHKRVYELRNDVNAVVHCHPAYCTYFASSKNDLNLCLLTEAIVAQGSIPKAKLAIPSTNEVADSITPFVNQTDAILLANHGAITYGANLEIAYSKMDSLEHFAKIVYLGLNDDSFNLVHGETVDLLQGMRSGYGMNTPCIPCDQKSMKSEKAIKEDDIVREVLATLKKSGL